jgi:hypothetical protein
MSKPYEIIMSPFEIWLAPVGESFPDPDTTPSGNWAKLGTNGKRNQGEDGITVTHNQTVDEHRNVGATGPIKAKRSEESLTIEMVLEDLTMAEYAKVLNDATVTTVSPGASQIGTKEIQLRQGNDVSTFALLCRGASPYGDGWNMQYQVPVVYQAENPAPNFTKSGAAGLACSFAALEDPDAATDSERFGKVIAQNADATG